MQITFAQYDAQSKIFNYREITERKRQLNSRPSVLILWYVPKEPLHSRLVSQLAFNFSTVMSKSIPDSRFLDDLPSCLLSQITTEAILFLFLKYAKYGTERKVEQATF